MKTPEGKLKDQVKAFLKERGVASLSAPVENARGYYHMYVPSGYGDPTLDFTGCYKGFFFIIETKAPTKEPTPRQWLIINAVKAAQGTTIWGNDWTKLYQALKYYFDMVDGI